MTPEEHRAFWRNVQFVVDKDVVRTDRSNQFFRGEGNPNVESMRCPPALGLGGLREGGRGLPVHTITPEAEVLSCLSHLGSSPVTIVSQGSP